MTRRNPLHQATQSLFAGLLCLLAVTGCAKQQSLQEAPTTTVLVQAAALSPSKGGRWVGKVRTQGNTTLCFGVAGRVLAVRAEVGDVVAAGAILAELDPEPFRLALRQAEAELLAARPQLEEATRRKDSEQRLWQQSATSRADLDAALSAHAAASARVQAAESAVAIASRQLRECTLVAPCAGTIAQRLCRVAAWVEVGGAAFEFDSHGELEVLLALPEDAAAMLRAGDRVGVRAGGGELGETGLRGTIHAVAKRSQAGGVNEVIVRLPAEAGVRPGQLVSVVLDGAAAAGGMIHIPATALIPRPVLSEGAVFVYERSSASVRRRKVLHGAPEGSRIVIEHGLQAGELVVVSGVGFLRDGQKVTAQVRN